MCACEQKDRAGVCSSEVRGLSHLLRVLALDRQAVEGLARLIVDVRLQALQIPCIHWHTRHLKGLAGEEALLTLGEGLARLAAVVHRRRGLVEEAQVHVQPHLRLDHLLEDLGFGLA